jgi:hypothetical protein
MSFAAPGGLLVQDGDVYQTKNCLFGLCDSMEKVKAYDQQVFVKLMRRQVNELQCCFRLNWNVMKSFS